MLKDIESFVKDDIKVNRLVYGCTKNEEYCAQALTELRDMIKQKDTVIENLKETLEENIKQIEDFKKQIEIITQHLDELYHQNVGVSYSVGKQMTAYYKEGMSLRKIAQIFSCDKSTVKRRLERIGVKIRE